MTVYVPHRCFLICHLDTPSGVATGVVVSVQRLPEGLLSFVFSLKADLSRLRIPESQPPRQADGLWQHTCFEVFVGAADGSGRIGHYQEFNFSPSGEWASYGFSRYRERRPLVLQPPLIKVQRDDEGLQLEARIRLDAMLPPPGSGLRLALAAVLEEKSGVLSYWALRHPPGRPDFHHPDGFALSLDELDAGHEN